MDGKLLFAVEEERINRKKHTTEFPVNAIRECLNYVKADINDVDIIAVGFNPNRYIKHKYLEYSLQVYPKANKLMLDEMHKVKLFLSNESFIREKLGYNNELQFLSHHDCHMASTFYVSSFNKAALLSIDGLGEIESSVTGIGNECSLSIFEEDKIKYPVSIGLLYAAVTAYLGFRPFFDEQKIMGLAPYGDPTAYLGLFRKIVIFEANGRYSFDNSYLTFPFELNTWFSEKFLGEMGPFRKPDEPLSDHHKNVAAASQKITEDIILHMATHLYKKVKTKNLCMAGGVALNCVANGRLLKKGPFEKIYVQPGSNDAGVAIGAALLSYYKKADNPRRKEQALSSYWGPEYDKQSIIKVLEKMSVLAYKEYEDAAPIVAKYLAEGKIISWFNGRMEFGPRALGNRSILANPISNKYKDYLNKEIKKREWWRPLCPSMLFEARADYLEDAIESPFMILMDYVKKEKISCVEGIVHVDGTVRPQTLRREWNPIFYHLIEEFYKITGEPVLLNTSQNRNFEPIVMTPEDAIECFIDTKIDYLVFNNQIIVYK